jgi:hypothetical protein
MTLKVPCNYCAKPVDVYPSELERNKHIFCCPEHYHKWISENKIKSGINSNLWKNAQVEVKCEQCGTIKLRYQSQIKWRGSRFCDRKCKAQWYSEHKSGKNSWHWKEKIKCKCLVCGKEFEDHQCNVERGNSKYCSHKCKGLAHTGENNPMFGKIISDETRLKQSTSHLGKNRGADNPNWNGGVSPLYHLIRSNPKMDDWRKKVFKRDRYKDIFTGETGDIIAHHLIPFMVILEKYNIKSIDDALVCEALWDIRNGITLSRKNHQKYHAVWKNMLSAPISYKHEVIGCA